MTYTQIVDIDGQQYLETRKSSNDKLILRVIYSTYQPPPMWEISSYKFIKLLTRNERKQIRKSNDEDVIDFMDMIENYIQTVASNNPDLIAGLDVLTSVGLIAPGRKDEILTAGFEV